jgi:hypothetical protein
MGGIKLCVLFFVMCAFAFTCGHSDGVRASEGDSVTFNNQVVRILQQRCQICHHQGDIAPFSLVTYGEAKLFAEAMLEAIESREMPPWKASPECGEFDDERRMSNDEVETFARWVEAGTPEGDPADAPQPLQFKGDWPLGLPDVVLKPEANFDVMIGDDIYRCFSFPTDSRGERFLSAIDVRPGARSVVHHAIVYIDESGESKRFDEADAAPGFNCPNDAEFTKSAVAWWMPGAPARFEPAGDAWKVPKSARIVIKIHYHVHHGGGQSDQTEVGLYFAREPVRKELRTLLLTNTSFAIPAGDSHYKVTASNPPLGPRQAAHAVGVAPHMQLLGREMEVEAASPDGETRCLISTEDWDSHWQGLYRFKEPVALPPGTQLSLTAYYNNSFSNPENPNFPPKTVRYGERTQDETCMAFIKYTLDAENREMSSPRIDSVGVDSGGQLVVKGKGFSSGADIELDGKRLADSKNHKKKGAKRLLSGDDWKSLIPPGKEVLVTVLNTDGVRSPAISFSR